LKQKKEPERPKQAAPVTRKLSAQQASTPPEAMPVSTPLEPDIASTDSLIMPTELMETGLRTQDQIGEQLALPELDPQTADTEVMPPPSPHAGAVAQLEAWLHTIESRRHDRDATNEPHPKTS